MDRSQSDAAAAPEAGLPPLKYEISEKEFLYNSLYNIPCFFALFVLY